MLLGALVVGIGETHLDETQVEGVRLTKRTASERHSSTAKSRTRSNASVATDCIAKSTPAASTRPLAAIWSRPSSRTTYQVVAIS